jgi:hypothetical protein
MGNLIFVVNGVNFLSANQICTGVVCNYSGRYYSSDNKSDLGNPPLVSSQEFDDREVVFPGVDDVGIKRFGRRTRTIAADLIYVGATKAATEAYIESDWGSSGTLIQLARYTIIMPGGTSYQGCRLIQSGAQEIAWGPPLDDAFVVQVKAVWKQYSQKN